MAKSSKIIFRVGMNYGGDAFLRRLGKMREKRIGHPERKEGRIQSG